VKAQQVVENGEPLVGNDIARPDPGPGQVLVRVRHCGVCHTDLHLHDGYFGLGGERKLELAQTRPLTMGHEIHGEVAAVGAGVAAPRVGDSVAVYPWIGCGECGLCASDREHLCGRARSIGVHQPGGYAEYVLVPDARYTIPADGVDPAQAGLLMCSGITAYSALGKVAEAFDRGEVLIIGAGGVGTMALQFARALFDRVPMVADISEAKLAAAAELGATTWNLGEADVGKRLKSATGGIAAVIDFVGAESTVDFALRATGQAGHVVVVGLFGGLLQTPIPLLALRATTIQGSYVGSLQDARATLELARNGRVAPIPTDLRPLSAANRALSDLREGAVTGRVVLAP
jgi:D-arabinose 1-dehydrogenase-like Zn-dependent alcohol dehydrogenase